MCALTHLHIPCETHEFNAWLLQRGEWNLVSSQLKYPVPVPAPPPYPPSFFLFYFIFTFLYFSTEGFIGLAAWEVCGVEAVGVLGMLYL